MKLFYLLHSDAWQPEDQPASALNRCFRRRTYLLLILFDFIFVFVICI